LVDFSKVLVSVSVNIENIMYRWSDYKRLREKIFFNPPIRESWQVKAMFKWINRGVIAWLNISKFDENINKFLSEQIRNENILSITLAKIINYNLSQIWFEFKKKDLIINY
jgi:hypothetical protein